MVKCNDCGGSGLKDKEHLCPVCDGSGQVIGEADVEEVVVAPVEPVVVPPVAPVEPPVEPTAPVEPVAPVVTPEV